MSSKKKISIAQFHWGFPPTIGGVETHLALMLPKMVEMGHKVNLLTGAVNGAADVQDYHGVRVTRNILMDLNWLYERGQGALEKKVREHFRGFIDDVKPDVIHAHNMHYFIKSHTEALVDEAKRVNVPLILTAHNVWDDALFLELTREIQWDHIIAVSHYIRKELIGVGCDPKKVTAIHHGIDTDKFKPNLNTSKIYKRYPQLKGRRVIFHPARIGLAKGCDLSIKALYIIKKKYPDAFLMMAGSKNIIDWGDNQASDIAYFVDLVNHFDLQKDVLIDSYTLEDMPYIYNLAEVVLYPSTAQEPFGMTMLEAFACKKPIIVTQAGGMPEIVKNNENGFVIQIKDFNMLADRILQVFKDKKLGLKFGREGYKMVQKRYKAIDVTRANLDIYDKFLA